jgi:hypothetical protein
VGGEGDCSLLTRARWDPVSSTRLRLADVQIAWWVGLPITAS